MKIFILAITFSFFLVGYGQQSSVKPSPNWPPSFFLIDSANMGMAHLYFDPNKIANINVVDSYYDSAKHIHGKIFITLKDPKSLKFLTISDVEAIYNKDTKKSTIFMLDNDILKDTATFKIDSSYILKVEITRASEIDYLKNTFPDFIIFKIITRTKENIDKQNQIWIRGAETTWKR